MTELNDLLSNKITVYKAKLPSRESIICRRRMAGLRPHSTLGSQHSTKSILRKCANFKRNVRTCVSDFCKNGPRDFHSNIERIIFDLCSARRRRQLSPTREEDPFRLTGALRAAAGVASGHGELLSFQVTNGRNTTIGRKRQPSEERHS